VPRNRSTAGMRPWVISSLIVLADQLSKFAVRAGMSPAQSLPLIPNVFHLTYVQNTGAAFGLMKGQQVLFIIFSILVMGWIIQMWVTHPPRDRIHLWSWSLIFGGALGNLIDRLRLGYVVDFLDLRVWPVFNIGDSAITIGVGLLMWASLKRK